MKNIISLALVAIIIMLTLNSCKKDQGTPSENEIWLENSKFSSSTKTIAVGTTITFTNKDNMTHTVSETNNLFTSSADMGKNDTFVFTFSSAGTYHIYCKYHPSMTATITVQ